MQIQSSPVFCCLSPFSLRYGVKSIVLVVVLLLPLALCSRHPDQFGPLQSNIVLKTSLIWFCPRSCIGKSKFCPWLVVF